MKRALPFAIYLAAGVLLSISARADPASVRIHGVVSRFDGSNLTVKADSGKTTLIGVQPSTSIVHSRIMSLGDVRTGDFIGALALKDATGKLRAQAIRVFPNFLEAPGEGQYPIDSNSSRIVTNGSASAVSVANGMLTLTFHGAGSAGDSVCTGRAQTSGLGCTGSADFVIAHGVPIIEVSSGDTSLFRSGAIVSIVAVFDPSNLLTATNVTVERDAKPAQ